MIPREIDPGLKVMSQGCFTLAEPNDKERLRILCCSCMTNIDKQLRKDSF